MRSIMTASALGLVLSTPIGAHAAPAQQAELEALKQQVELLVQKVRELEARQQAPAAAAGDQLAQLEQQNAALDSRLAEVEAANDRQTDQLAQGADLDRKFEWAKNVKLKGDMRYRHEMIDQQGAVERNRQRVRVRLGLDARINDSWSAGFQLASGDIGDPRSTNSTLTGANTRKSLEIDLAYVDWKATDSLLVTLGKQKYPWFRPGNSLFYDGDVNPEGVALKFGGKEGVFANAWGYWLSEVSAGADANVVGAQFGYRVGGLTLAGGYWDYGAVQRSSLAFTDAPAGNSTYNGNASCNLPPPATGPTRCYLYDYDLVEIGAQYDFKLGNLPVMVFADYLQNQDPDDRETGYNFGFLAGKAGNPGTWEFGVLYQQVEADAQFGAFIDSDFAGGATQGQGTQFRLGYAPLRNMTLNVQYFLNDRSYDTAGELDYKRLQLDLNYKF